MSARDLIEGLRPGDSALAPMAGSAVVGELVAVSDRGAAPWVVFAGMPGAAALRARSLCDLHAVHVGKAVLIVFERGDPELPIVVGPMFDPAVAFSREPAGAVEVHADGERLIISARHQLVLRCGKSSLTMTQDGRVELRGDTILTQAVGANRIRGGSVELN